MFDAYGKILRDEGISGLYRGFWVSSVQIVSGKLIFICFVVIKMFISVKKRF